MKINIVTQKNSTVQEFFSKELNFKQRVEKKKLQIAGMICKQMEKLGLSRTKLAEDMGIQPSRVTAMLDGTQNLTIETIMRASEALDQRFECTMIPKEHVLSWRSCDSTNYYEVVSNISDIVEYSTAQFDHSSLAQDDLSLIA